MRGYGAGNGYVKIVNVTLDRRCQVYVVNALYSHSEQLITLVLSETYKQILGYVLIG